MKVFPKSRTITERALVRFANYRIYRGLQTQKTPCKELPLCLYPLPMYLKNRGLISCYNSLGNSTKSTEDMYNVKRDTFARVVKGISISLLIRD